MENMEDNKVIEYKTNQFSDEMQDSMISMMFELSKSHCMEEWLAVFVHMASSSHKMMDLEVSDLMNFHMSLFMSAVVNAPDCDAKNGFIDEAIQLLNTNRPVKTMS